MTVPVGATIVFTATGTVSAAATGDLVNSAEVLPPAGLANRTSAIATDSDPITARADLGLTKTGPASIVAGNNLIYSITVTNAGPSDAVGVVVSDATPAGLVFVSNVGDCTTAFPCTLGTLAPGATRTITATFAVPITYPGLGPIVNVASVSASTPDDVAANNTASATTRPLNRNADVAISKTVAPASVLVGQPTTFTVVVANESGAGPRHRPGRAGPAAGRLDVCVGVGLTGQLRGRHRGVERSGPAERASGDADAGGDGDGGRRDHQPRAVSSPRTSPTWLRQQLGGGDRERAADADVSVTKIADRPAPLVGETVTFTVTVTNSGPSSATGAVVTDTLPGGPHVDSAIPSQGTYVAPLWTIGTLSETGPPATLTIVATVTAAGALVNTATITQQMEVDPNAANNSASVTLNAAESANLKVTKALTRSAPFVGGC